MILRERRQDFARINEIVRILIKYGFSTFAAEIKSKRQPIPLSSSNVSENLPDNVNVRIRYVLEELGTTFIKLGQTLSNYPELIGYDLAEELSNLQESAPVDDFETVQKIIESELSHPIDEIFDEFGEEPIASASIGQVHSAFLDNKQVAVKVQHPNMRDAVTSDIRIMKIIANRLDRRIETARAYNLPGLVEVFEKDMRKEFDYKFEAMNAVHLRDLLEPDEIYVPKVYHEYSTEKVLTMEYLEGVSLNTVIKAPDDEYDKKKIALDGADSFIKQILVHGFYHADPHPGNIFVVENDTVAFVDFGMMGHLDNDLREDLAKIFLFISEGDAKLLTKQLMYMGIVEDTDDYKQIEYEIMLLLDRYYGMQFNDVSGVIRGLMEEDVLNDYGVVLPRDLILVLRTISMIDDVGKALYPEFNTTEMIKPYVTHLLLDMVKPKRLISKSASSLMDIQHLSKKLPESLLNFFNVVEDGHLNIALASEEVEELNVIVSRIVNEIVLAIIIAALLIGSSLIMVIENGYRIFGYPILGFVGFMVSGLFGLILIIMIIRGGNF